MYVQTTAAYVTRCRTCCARAYVWDRCRTDDRTGFYRYLYNYYQREYVRPKIIICTLAETFRNRRPMIDRRRRRDVRHVDSDTGNFLHAYIIIQYLQYIAYTRGTYRDAQVQVCVCVCVSLIVCTRTHIQGDLKFVFQQFYHINIRNKVKCVNDNVFFRKSKKN